ncbi:MAG: type VI secretion protein [Crocinitomix sp.]|nr:type VI secretion protein [Crocinitomix sp.]
MAAAAKISDKHFCPKVEPGSGPHKGLNIIMGSADVFINGLGAARKGDLAPCIGPPDSISEGSSKVNINGKPAAREGDPTKHEGKIMSGSDNVNIGG